MTVLALALVATSGQTAWAQRGQGRGGGAFGGGNLMLLSQKSVQEELHLSADQTKQIEQAAEKQRESMGGLRDLGQQERRQKLQELNKANEGLLAEVLKEDQLKRLKQISLQQRGAGALADPEVAQTLGLTDEQKSQIQTIQRESQQEMRGLFQGGGDRQEARKKMDSLRSASTEKALGLLSTQQREKWTILIGETFKGEIRPAFQGRGNRPGALRRTPANRPSQTSAVTSPFRFAAFASDKEETSSSDQPAPPAHAKRHHRHGHARQHAVAGHGRQGGAGGQHGHGQHPSAEADHGDRTPHEARTAKHHRHAHGAHHPGGDQHASARSQHHPRGAWSGQAAYHHDGRGFGDRTQGGREHAGRHGFPGPRHVAGGHHRHPGHHGAEHRSARYDVHYDHQSRYGQWGSGHRSPHHFASWHHHRAYSWGPPHHGPDHHWNPGMSPRGRDGHHDQDPLRSAGPDGGDSVQQLAHFQHQLDSLAHELSRLRDELSAR
jgi:hypothetical protein